MYRMILIAWAAWAAWAWAAPKDNIRIPDDELTPERILLAPLAGERRDYGHERLGLEAAQKMATGKKVRVAVLDTGIDSDHPDLSGAVVASKDFTGSRNGAADVQGHGTHCAGIIGARSMGTGLVGAAPDVELLNAKCLGDRGFGSDTGIADAIDWAIEQKADVISGSLGSGSASPRIVAAVERALKAGIICVFAAGNSGPGNDTVGWPGAMPGVVCVAASDRADSIARFSSRGNQVFITAPGVSIDSTYPGGRYAKLSGTSMACPYISGIAALYVERARALGARHDCTAFMAALQSTAKDLPPPGRDTASGYGLAQAELVLKTIKAPGKDEPPTMPPPAPRDGFTGAVRYLYKDGRLMEITIER